jgi:hypothetical protein
MQVIRPYIFVNRDKTYAPLYIYCLPLYAFEKSHFVVLASFLEVSCCNLHFCPILLSYKFCKNPGMSITKPPNFNNVQIYRRGRTGEGGGGRTGRGRGEGEDGEGGGGRTGRGRGAGRGS